MPTNRSLNAQMNNLTFTKAALLSLALVQIHCTSSTTLHPTPENIPDATDPSLIIDLTNPEEWEEKPIFPDTTGFTTALYGRDDGEEHEILVWVQHLAYDGQGTLFILDADWRRDRGSNIKTVYMVDRDGQFLGSLGTHGEGPGEFTNPRRLLVAEQGNALFVVGRERHIDVFRRNESGSFSFSERVNMPTGAIDACTMRDHLYYLRYDAESSHIIHKYSLHGDYVTGFGDAYQSANLDVVENLSDRGSLVCNEQQGVLGYEHDFLPVVIGYDEAGKMLWRIRVDGIKSTTDVTETVGPGGGTVMGFSGENQFERGRGRLSLARVNGDEYFYLTVRVNLGNRQSRVPIFRVDAQTGAWQHIGHGFPPTIAEKDLQVRIPSPFDEVVQVRIRSRNE